MVRYLSDGAFDIKSLLSGMDIDSLKEKGKELWDVIVKLETEKYDLEEKIKRQDYDVDSMSTRISLFIEHVVVERAEGASETTKQTEGHQAWS